MEVDVGSSSLPPDKPLVLEPPAEVRSSHPWSCTKGANKSFNNLISRGRQVVEGKEMCNEREWFRQSHAGFPPSPYFGALTII